MNNYIIVTNVSKKFKINTNNQEGVISKLSHIFSKGHKKTMIALDNISLFDKEGKEIISGSLSIVNSQIKQLAVGNYVLRFESNGQIMTKVITIY